MRRLLADEAVQSEFLRGPQRPDQLPGRERAGANVADLASADEIVEHPQCLVDRDLGIRAST